jgi:hypothetical protein
MDFSPFDCIMVIIAVINVIFILIYSFVVRRMLPGRKKWGGRNKKGSGGAQISKATYKYFNERKNYLSSQLDAAIDYRLNYSR